MWRAHVHLRGQVFLSDALGLQPNHVINVALGEVDFWFAHLKVRLQGLYLALIVQEWNVVLCGLGLDYLDMATALLGLHLLV